MAFKIFTASLLAAWSIWIQAVHGEIIDHQRAVAELGRNPCPPVFFPSDEQKRETRLKYNDLFWRQPNVWGVGEGLFSTPDGGWAETVGIVVMVSERVDQSGLQMADRLPACLEGVPVQIEERAPPGASQPIDLQRAVADSGRDACVTAGIPTDERIHEIREKYDPLFWRQPNVHAVGEGFFSDGKEGWSETMGIVLSVTERADQSTLPPEDQIPACLEGVPVQIEVVQMGVVYPPDDQK